MSKSFISQELIEPQRDSVNLFQVISLAINLRLDSNSKSHQVTFGIAGEFICGHPFISKMPISEISLEYKLLEGNDGALLNFKSKAFPIRYVL